MPIDRKPHHYLDRLHLGFTADEVRNLATLITAVVKEHAPDPPAPALFQLERQLRRAVEEMAEEGK